MQLKETLQNSTQMTTTNFGEEDPALLIFLEYMPSGSIKAVSQSSLLKFGEMGEIKFLANLYMEIITLKGIEC